MVLSPQDAADALRDVETTQTRSATLHGYERSAPHLDLWGVLWVVGYGLNDVFPAHGQAIWAAIVPGLFGGFISLRAAGQRVRWRFGAVFLTLFAFFVAAFFIMSPVTGRQIAAFIPLVVAVAYVLIGIFRGPRYIATGLVVAALTLLGFALLKEHFFLWMAGVGGAAMILAGIWLRQA